MPYVGWGVQFIDYNNSGLLGLLIANGHIYESIEKQQPGITYPEPPLLLSNSGEGKYRDMKAAAGVTFNRSLSPAVSRRQISTTTAVSTPSSRA